MLICPNSSSSSKIKSSSLVPNLNPGDPFLKILLPLETSLRQKVHILWTIISLQSDLLKAHSFLIHFSHCLFHWGGNESLEAGKKEFRSLWQKLTALRLRTFNSDTIRLFLLTRSLYWHLSWEVCISISHSYSSVIYLFDLSSISSVTYSFN